MNVLDFIIIGFILLLGVLGYRKGFIQTLGDLVGLVLAVVLASRFYLWLGNVFGGSDFAIVMAFLLIFVVVIKFVSLVFWALGKIFKLISIIPFLQNFDKILGGILGLIEGVFVLVVLIFFLSRYSFSPWFSAQLLGSFLVPILYKASYIFLPLFPEALKKIKGVI